MSSWRSVALAVLLGGCMPTRYYKLPISARDARSTMGPLVAAARDMGYSFWRWDDTVGVQVDAQTRLSYLFDSANRYVLCVQLTRRGGAEARLAAGKRASDEIWKRAMSIRAATPPPVVAPEPLTPVITNYGLDTPPRSAD